MSRYEAAMARQIDAMGDALGPNMGCPPRRAQVLRERAFHRTEIPPVQDLAIVRGLSALVVEREAEIRALRMAMQEARLELKRGRRPAWKRCRDAKAILEEALQGREG